MNPQNSQPILSEGEITIDQAGNRKNNFRLMALDDEDFKPLWVEISEI
jgi:hypothetical protein